MLLRRTHPQDISAILEMERHPDNERYVHRWEQEEHMAAAMSEHHLHIVIENLAGRPIGYIIAAGLHPESDEMQLIRLVVVEKGKGYGKEALKLIMGLVFRELNKKRLRMDLKASNERARNLCESVGFYAEPVRHRNEEDGTEETLLAMAIGEAEYFGRHAR
ncbi:GNAT family N-acetyltransferase [Paenibacillus xanthanilyticus]